MTAADRMRRYRERQRKGEVVARPRIDLVAVSELLIDAGYLREADADDRDAIDAALSKMIAALVLFDDTIRP